VHNISQDKSKALDTLSKTSHSPHTPQIVFRTPKTREIQNIYRDIFQLADPASTTKCTKMTC